ncbi:hypothetical protein ACOSP7_020230 [Xanthoceras sorbifolium]
MPNPSLLNSWTKEIKVEVWILEPDAIKKITLCIILHKLFVFLGQFIFLPLKELQRVTQLAHILLKIGMQLNDFGSGLLYLQLYGLPKDLRFLDLCCQLLLSPYPSSKLIPCLHEIVTQVPPLRIIPFSLNHIFICKTTRLKKKE